MNKMSLFLVLLKGFDSVGTSNLQFLTDLDNWNWVTVEVSNMLSSRHLFSDAYILMTGYISDVGAWILVAHQLFTIVSVMPTTFV